MTNRTTAPVGSCVRFSAIAVLCAALVAGAAGEALSQYAPQPRRPLFPTAPALPQQPHPAVARVVVQEVDGQSYGSGTLVHTCGEYGLLVTNWHVVKDASGPIEVIFPDGFRSAAHVVTTDKDWDLAALAIWRPNVTPAPISSSVPRIGEPLAIAGYGEGRYRSAAGVCTQYLAPARDLPQEIVELSVAARNGDSGGPIFNSRGELAGVLFGANRNSTAGSHCGRVSMFLAPILARAVETPAADGPMVAANEPQSTLQPLLPLDPVAPVEQTPADIMPSALRELKPINHSPSPVAALAPQEAPTVAAPIVQSFVDEPVEDSALLSAVSEDAAKVAAVWQQRVETPKTSSDDWTRWAGETPLEQAKTGLAAIGLLVVARRMLRSGNKPAEKKSEE